MPIVNSNDINHAINIKNKCEYSNAYVNNASTSLFYPDSGTGAAAATNTGFTAKRQLTEGGVDANIILNLNRYLFFDAFKDTLPIPGKLELNIQLALDNDLIFRAGAADEGRVVITKWFYLCQRCDLMIKVFPNI